MREIKVGRVMTAAFVGLVVASWLLPLGGCATVPPNADGAPVTLAQQLAAEQAAINAALANGTLLVQFACTNAQTGLVKLQSVDPHAAQSLLQHNPQAVTVAAAVCAAASMVPAGTQPPALVPSGA
jgi:hypothetical protein